MSAPEKVDAALIGIPACQPSEMLQLAMMGNLPYSERCDAILASPTLAESFNNLFSTLES